MERSRITEYLPALGDMAGACLFLLGAAFSLSFIHQVLCSNNIVLGIHVVRRKMQTFTINSAVLRLLY